jgi:hypothetical protein
MARMVPPPVRNHETGCLLWQGKLQPNGYPAGAHRRAYAKAHGPIPPGMSIDHRYDLGCRFKHCIEPTHLEAVPLIENIRRSYAARGLVDACGKGHAYTSENTLTKKRGRQCRICQREYRRNHYRKSKARLKV